VPSVVIRALVQLPLFGAVLELILLAWITRWPWPSMYAFGFAELHPPAEEVGAQ
jgi:hypothetical protein